jgi:hypothetical protein
LYKILLLCFFLSSNLFAGPNGIVNVRGTCYSNATLQNLFVLDKLNRELVKIRPEPNSILYDYLNAYRTCSRKQGYCAIGNYGKLLNRSNEPTEIMQEILVEAVRHKPSLAKMFQIIVVPSEEIGDLLKKVKSRVIANTNYLFVIIHNPSNKCLNGKSVIDISLFQDSFSNLFFLKSMVSACHLSYENSRSYNINHSIAFVNSNSNWYLCSDTHVEKVSNSKLTRIANFSSGEKFSRAGLANLVPGVLIFEKI